MRNSDYILYRRQHQNNKGNSRKSPAPKAKTKVVKVKSLGDEINDIFIAFSGVYGRRSAINMLYAQ